MKLKAILGAFISGIVTTVTRAYAYNQAMKIISKSKITLCPSPDIKYIALHSPLTLYEACEVYPFLQAHNLSKEEIIKYACMTGGNLEAIEQMVIKNLKEPTQDTWN